MIEELLSTDYLLRERAAWKKQAELANNRADRFLAALLQIVEGDPPSTLDEPDTDAEVILKLRQIAREALNTTKGEP